MWVTLGTIAFIVQILRAESLVPLKVWPRLKELRIQGNPLTFTCKGKLPRESHGCTWPLLFNDMQSTDTVYSLPRWTIGVCLTLADTLSMQSRVNNIQLCMCGRPMYI